MKLTEEDWRRIGIILKSETADFASLARRAGFNPAQDFQGADLSRVDFGTTNLADFDLTGTNLAGANLSRVSGLEAAMLRDVKYDAATRLPPGWGITPLPGGAKATAMVGLPQPPPVARPNWADDFGRDAFGTWASIRVPVPRRRAILGLFGAKADSVTQRLRWIPPGGFLRGSPPDEEGRFDHEGPQRPVTIAQGFWLFDTPCTQALWQAVVGNNPSKFKGPTRPVETVGSHDVQKFLDTLNNLVPGLNLSLPSEAQWEYACRAGTLTATYAGPNTKEVLDSIAWYDQNSEGSTQPVAQKLPNDWGLYDMLGNVWDWCADPYHDSYDGAPDDGSPRFDARMVLDASVDAVSAVVRGGAWSSDARRLRAANRDWRAFVRRGDGIGFRCTRVQVQIEALAIAEGGMSQLAALAGWRRPARSGRQRAGPRNGPSAPVTCG